MVNLAPLSAEGGPDFLIVGAPRCGTTALYTYLKQHPQIYLSVLKEPLFFGLDLVAPAHAIRDAELYAHLFAGAPPGSRRGEASVWYLSSTSAAGEIQAYQPATKIIMLLRNPIAVMSSLHALYLRTGNEDQTDFESALCAEAARQQGREIPPGAYFPQGLLYRQNVRFAEQVDRYLQHFERSRIHVVIFDDLVQEPARTYREVLAFLEVDCDFLPEFDLYRAQRMIRQQILWQLRHSRAEVREKVRLFNRHHEGQRSPVAWPLEQQLRQEFRWEVEQLSARLNRDLTCWIME